jgi:large subunit ribosomal protein L4
VQTDVSHLNVYDILNADKVIVEAAALAHISSFFGEDGAAWE